MKCILSCCISGQAWPAQKEEGKSACLKCSHEESIKTPLERNLNCQAICKVTGPNFEHDASRKVIFPGATTMAMKGGHDVQACEIAKSIDIRFCEALEVSPTVLDLWSHEALCTHMRFLFSNLLHSICIALCTRVSSKTLYLDSLTRRGT